ncbi:MAG: L-histidine N(alpha)-methyltransferase [Bacteroidota bacterium]|nr:L-histidine N(alpha)-methyltransferase [Bacteroidota bacterium]
MDNFLTDVLKGLQSSPKYLDSKYFYDKKGDELFQKIMESEEYYLTNAEMEIFSKQQSQIVDTVLYNSDPLDVIEFGPGDATKSVHLLKELAGRKQIENYVPIDISENIISLLNQSLPKQVPTLTIHGLAGEYFEMLSAAHKISSNKKLVLFLGANIGNFKFNEMPAFLMKLKSLLSAGDMVLIGFDLKKNPQTILSAYNDQQGFTKEFNLNLLSRINKELNGNFEIENFEHYPTYDPSTGACKSYLISTKEQSVKIGETLIHFEKNEPIFMEISQKYSVKEIDEIATECEFEVLADFFDSNRYFVDVILKCND